MPGAIMPCVALQSGAYLTDSMGPGFTVISFGPIPV
jgi:hypothetical protein